MSDNLREALKQIAVSTEASTIYCKGIGEIPSIVLDDESIDRVLAALAQPQNDAEAFPQAWRWIANPGDIMWTFGAYAPSSAVKAEPLYTAPPSPERMREALDDALAENTALRSANTKLVLAERDRLEALRAGDNHASDGKESNPTCTDCNGSGITLQTERRCSCQTSDPTPAPKGEPSQEWNEAVEAAAQWHLDRATAERRVGLITSARAEEYAADNIRALRREPEGER